MCPQPCRYYIVLHVRYVVSHDHMHGYGFLYISRSRSVDLSTDLHIPWTAATEIYSAWHACA